MIRIAERAWPILLAVAWGYAIFRLIVAVVS